jgi:hypothetical protein
MSLEAEESPLAPVMDDQPVVLCAVWEEDRSSEMSIDSTGDLARFG